MLHSLFPRAHRRFLSLPLLGPLADGFDDWLTVNGYAPVSRKNSICVLPHVDAALRHRQVKEVANITHAVLHDCWTAILKIHPFTTRTVRTLERYLAANGLITDGEPLTEPSRTSMLIDEYANYLREVRGFAASTVSHHRDTTQCFLQHLDKEKIALKKIRGPHIESYITKVGKRLSRPSLQHDIGAVRGFLRFLAIDGRVPAGLANQIDTPRLYQLEKLPRSLPWETVRTLLRSIDRTSAMGLRDYAIFLPRNSRLLGCSGYWVDLVSEAGGFELELLDLQFSVPKVVEGSSFVRVFHAVVQHAVDQPGQLGGHGLDRTRGAQLGSESAKLRSEIGIAFSQRAGRHL